MARLAVIYSVLRNSHKKQLKQRRNERRLMRYTDKAFSMNEDEFKANYRVSKDLFEEIYENIKPFMPTPKRRSDISPKYKVLVALSFYATGSYQKLVGGTYGTLMSQQSVSRCIRDVTAALNHPMVQFKWIKFPQTRQDRDAIKRRFFEKFHIPSVIGCIDGTHVAIIRPIENEERFFNRKHFHSRNVLIISDADLRILSVDASFGGASHDSFVWNQHPVKQHLIDLNNNGENVFLLDAEAVLREEEAISPDELSVAQLRQLKEHAQNYTFQTEVNRMMKLIINSLYRNKEIFLRELISNGSDALDKIRLLSLTDRDVLETNSDLSIRIKAEPDKRLLHIIDSGIGMSRNELINNLGTIAKSGTAEFLSKMQDAEKSEAQEMNDMIGQFGVGFYSAFLVADKVTVVSKNNADKQHVWESDANAFSVAEDPRGDTLKRGTHITLHVKEEAADYLQPDTIRNLVKKYSQFINFPIYLWASRTETVEEPEEPEDKADADDDDAQVEDAADDKRDTKKTEKTVWDWELMNDNKPIWTRKPSEVNDDEYTSFYKSLTKDSSPQLAKAHFVAEGEVTFRALLFVPRVQPADSFNRYGTKTDHIKLYVRRVFITDEFNDLMPNYLAFIQGIVDSDDLPLNVSRETLQQHKLIKIIKKKLVRKVLDMLKKIPDAEYDGFWKEYSTNIKLGVIEDPSNRSRLAKLLRFHSSRGDSMTFLADYVARMKPNQNHIYYIAGSSRAEVEKSPFAERLVRRGYEVLYLTEAVDEYCLSSLPEYDGKKFQNIAKEIFDLEENDQQKERLEAYKKQFEPLTTWLGNKLSTWVTRCVVSRRLDRSPAALAATAFGWTGNMERLALSNAHQKADDAQRKHHLTQKKMLEINPRHPLIAELLRRVQQEPDAPTTARAADTLYRTAAIRSGYLLQEGQAVDFAEAVEDMLQQSLGLPPGAAPPDDDEDEAAELEAEADELEAEADEPAQADHEEL